MARRSFDDGKDADALRTIGELGKALGIKAHVLRYWEEQFPMLQPLKRSGGRRYYRTDDVALVEAIDRLVNEEGYTLKGARSAICPTGTSLPASRPIHACAALPTGRCLKNSRRSARASPPRSRTRRARFSAIP